MKRRHVALVTLLGLVVFTTHVWAQGLPTAKPEQVGLSAERLERVTRALRGEIEAGKHPRRRRVVARKGHVVYFEALGVRDKSTGKPMPKDAIFRIYSMTKPLVSVAAMMLVEDGKLQLTDPVSKFLPAVEAAAGQRRAGRSGPRENDYTLVSAEREMTVQDLLRHSAGLAYGQITQNTPVREAYDQGPRTTAGDYDCAISRLPSSSMPRPRAARAPARHGVGVQHATDVLGRVVETVSGQRLAEFLDDRLFRPLADERHRVLGAEGQAHAWLSRCRWMPSTASPSS